jgi:hypothetical protein
LGVEGHIGLAFLMLVDGSMEQARVQG